jgi:N-acetylglucosaminyl-diphospho-decaprenol L-rhamnosyltransferase
LTAADRQPGVSAIVVNYEGGQLLLDCLESLQEQPGLLETIVVDNGSADGSARAAKSRYPTIKLVAPGENLGFAGGANFGAGAARGDVLLFLNPDVRINPDSVAMLASNLVDPRVGVVGPPLATVAAGGVEYGGTLDLIGSPVGLTRRRPPIYVSGCALMTRTDDFRELGGFDARFFMFLEDIDYCWRMLLRGREIRIADVAPVWHQGGAATPGGYVNERGVSSTQFRIALRERNTLAVLLKCYSGALACAVVPVYVLQSLMTAAALAVAGRPATARAVIEGLRWNATELQRTLELRRSVQASRAVDDVTIVRRMYRGVWKLSLLVRFGMPRVFEPDANRVGAGE